MAEIRPSTTRIRITPSGGARSGVAAPLEPARRVVARALVLDGGDPTLDDADPDHTVGRVLIRDDRTRVHVAVLHVELGDRVADREQVLGVDLPPHPPPH